MTQHGPSAPRPTAAALGDPKGRVEQAGAQAPLRSGPPHSRTTRFRRHHGRQPALTILPHTLSHFRLRLRHRLLTSAPPPARRVRRKAGTASLPPAPLAGWPGAAQGAGPRRGRGARGGGAAEGAGRWLPGRGGEGARGQSGAALSRRERRRFQLRLRAPRAAAYPLAEALLAH